MLEKELGVLHLDLKAAGELSSRKEESLKAHANSDTFIQQGHTNSQQGHTSYEYYSLGLAWSNHHNIAPHLFSGLAKADQPMTEQGSK